MPDSSCNVADFLRDFATSQPDAPAIRFPASGYRTESPTWDTWTYAELDRHSDSYARGFANLGIRPGDRTLVLFKPSLDFYAVLFGLFKCGAVPVLLDPGMGMPGEGGDHYDSSSPLTRAERLADSLLIVHGMADDNVFFDNTVQMIDALQEAAAPFEMMSYPGKRHGITGEAESAHLWNMFLEFLDRKLAAGGRDG